MIGPSIEVMVDKLSSYRRRCTFEVRTWGALHTSFILSRPIVGSRRMIIGLWLFMIGDLDTIVYKVFMV